MKETRHDKLNNHTTVFTGITLQPHLTQSREEDHAFFIQPRDIILSSNEIDYSNCILLKKGAGIAKQQLRAGDILLVAKGKASPVVIFEATEKITFASSAFIIIRPVTNHIASAYIAWFLHLPDTQAVLQATKTGTTVLNLSIKSVQELSIPTPPIEQQKLMGNIYKNRMAEKAYQVKLMEKQDLLLNIQLQQLL